MQLQWQAWKSMSRMRMKGRKIKANAMRASLEDVRHRTHVMTRKPNPTKIRATEVKASQRGKHKSQMRNQTKR